MPKSLPLPPTVPDQAPRAWRFESIKSQIVVLAMAATLIPSVGMAWVSYVQNRAALTDKITEELASVSAQTAREIDLWYKERVYDLRVFASSYEVTENMERARRTDGDGQAGTRLSNYLASVEERFPDYEELMVVDLDGELLATSAESLSDLPFPPGWLARVAANEVVVAPGDWDEQLGQPLMTVAVPVNPAGRTFAGALVANVTYRAVLTTLLVFAPGDSGDLFVIGPDGSEIVSLHSSEQPNTGRRLTPAATGLLFGGGASPAAYTNWDGNEVLGTLQRVLSLDLAVVAEVTAEEAYAQITELRDVTALLVLGLLFVVGFIAYRLGLLVVRPLDRLTTAAAEVAAGGFDADLPVGKGEVGYLTEVFNGMVDRLAENRQQLEDLLVTDPLTGISNRRYLMERMSDEVRRSRRSSKPFAILMMDVDHFKQFNDTHGHVAGDQALKAVADVLEDQTRDVDHVARYGGEEFLVLLADTDVAGAVLAAKRIREGLGELGLTIENQSVTLTLSAGAAEFAVHGDSPESLVAAADAALYKAKAKGRDCVVRATRMKSTPKAAAERKALRRRSTKGAANGKKRTSTNGSRASSTNGARKASPSNEEGASTADLEKAEGGGSKKAAAKEAAAKKKEAKTAEAKKAAAKKAEAKKATAKKAAAKKATAKKAAAKKAKAKRETSPTSVEKALAQSRGTTPGEETSKKWKW